MSRRRHLSQAPTFILVGLVGLVVDVTVYNLLVFGTDGEGMLFDHPLTAKVLAISTAIVTNYIGNRWLTFRSRRNAPVGVEIWRYGLVSGGGLVVQLLPLAFSRYVLGWDSPLSDNIFGSVIGLGAGTVVRYIGYDRWVFVDRDLDRLSR